MNEKETESAREQVLTDLEAVASKRRKLREDLEATEDEYRGLVYQAQKLGIKLAVISRTAGVSYQAVQQTLARAVK